MELRLESKEGWWCWRLERERGSDEGSAMMDMYILLYDLLNVPPTR